MAEHTPTSTPWKAEGWLIIRDLKTRSRRAAIASVHRNGFVSDEQADANAALIVRAVNSHERLLHIIKECRKLEVLPLGVPQDIDDIIGECEKVL